MERQSYMPHDFRRHLSRLGRDVTDIFDSDNIEEGMWQELYSQHKNNERESLGKLLSIKKRPYSAFFCFHNLNKCFARFTRVF